MNSGDAGVPPIVGISTPAADDFVAISGGSRASVKDPYIAWKQESSLRFGTANTFGGQYFSEKLRINADGNVGIGTTGPGKKLHVMVAAGSNDGIILSRAGGAGNRADLRVDAAGSHGILELLDDTGTSQVLLDSSNGSSYIRSGNVGIGTTAPGAALDVQSDGPSTKPFRVLNSESDKTDFEVEVQGDNRPWLRMYQTGTEKIRLDVGDKSFFIGGTSASVLRTPRRHCM